MMPRWKYEHMHRYALTRGGNTSCNGPYSSYSTRVNNMRFYKQMKRNWKLTKGLGDKKVPQFKKFTDGMNKLENCCGIR